MRELKRKGYQKLLVPRRSDLNLLKQQDVLDFFKKNHPNYVFMAAAKVGGIQANNLYRSDFIVQNITIQNNTFNAAYQTNVDKFLFLGSSCIYPKECPQPIKEEYLLTGPLEQTNEPYAIAKIAGLKMAENYCRQHKCNYFSVMPTNLYGINDNFHKENSHVIPGLIAKTKEAIDCQKEHLEIWGTGRPRREFLYVDDLAKACIFLMETNQKLPYYINVGTGKDITIKKLAELIVAKMGYKGKLFFNTKYPDGTMKKLLDVSKIKSLGWEPQISLEEGLEKVVDFYLKKEGIRFR